MSTCRECGRESRGDDLCSTCKAANGGYDEYGQSDTRKQCRTTYAEEQARRVEAHRQRVEKEMAELEISGK